MLQKFKIIYKLLDLRSEFYIKKFSVKVVVMYVICAVILLIVLGYLKLVQTRADNELLELMSKFDSLYEYFVWQCLTGFLLPARSLELIAEIEAERIQEVAEIEFFKNMPFTCYLDFFTLITVDDGGEMYYIVVQPSICKFRDDS
mmetsp:Transcript_21906/g.10315  ORF Transcript_21906/g.10315 Transcript_21906/m.10315 type:complete len:145 (-) Transcript_21906:200-634(-)